MATRRSGKGTVEGRIRLDGGDEIGERPSLAIHVVDPEGDVVSSAKIGDDGTFRLDAGAVDRARRVVVTTADGSPDDATAVAFRAANFLELAEVGDIGISAVDWSKFLTVRRCVDATIRRCFPFVHVINDLVSVALQPQRSLGPLRPFPGRFGCAPVCVGTVEVYRRRCCCNPIVIDPPFELEPPFEIPFELPPFPEPEPFPPEPFPPGPGPGPDPAPFHLRELVLTGGTVDVTKLNGRRDAMALRTLKGDRLTQYLIARPYLWCHCGPATKVAEGFVGEHGTIHVCWREPLRLQQRNCHDEYSFVVKQNIAGATVTIYDGPAAGQWFDDDDDKQLTSYHPKAIGCREDDFPVDPGMPFVVLQDLGSTESHRLATPTADGPDSVVAPSPTSGLLDVGGVDYALGGSVQLRYHVSESMKGIGARFYRVQWNRANIFGDPMGDWETLPVATWKTWRVSGGTIEPGSHALGPNTVGTEHDLFHIPFETGGPLGADEEWQDGQFHAVVPTDSEVEGFYLVRIEVFDAAGNRLEPAGAGFTFRRWNTPTTTVAVPFGAMTHLIRTENRPVHADIVDVTGPGANAGDCKFFVGHAGENVSVEYRAFHPQTGLPSFMTTYRLEIRRGISGSVATPALVSSVEAGEGGSPAVHAVTIADLLDGEDKCSFAVTLHVEAKVHNGSGRLSGLDRNDISAFAVELA
jgi:hypothetical protein